MMYADDVTVPENPDSHAHAVCMSATSQRKVDDASDSCVETTLWPSNFLSFIQKGDDEKMGAKKAAPKRGVAAAVWPPGSWIRTCGRT